ncbi:hypothetical protein FE773_01650 [Caminibacter mediatlanticus TB-2]|uniref:Flagellar FliJ protein n=1 Tax=Caminibacter mediatlanticus TB-2 TaxID=391592 RepID=A0ABX5V8J4_9BACT|nr:flagellar export protein FliJ [Caminibacter mediatlanticus]QCT93929.1 hypothetical protein FE773_01650 [Caminibacter mediatlanticus TB-2]
MKTKFDSVVKIKKQKVDKIERNIQKINSSIKMLKMKIEELRKSFNSLSLPSSGNFATLQQISLQKNTFLSEIKSYENQIKILENRKSELIKELKKANIEYEKMKYLQNEEIKKKIKNIRLKESKEMDEIAIILRNK